MKSKGMTGVVAGWANRRTEDRRNVMSFLQAYGLWAVIILLLVAAAVITPGYMKPNKLMLLLRQAAPLGIVALGQLFVILVSGIDLSVGQVMSMTSVMASGIIMGEPNRILPAVAVVVGLAVASGFINGLIIAKRRVEPFVMTLAMMVIIQGFHWNYSKGANMAYVPTGFRQLGLGYIGPVPTPVILWAFLCVVAAVVLYRTPFGRRIYATGGNRVAARMSGVNVDLATIIPYVLCSLSGVLAGLISLGYVSVGDSRTGMGYELGSIAAVVIGGASLAGGRGRVSGNIAGVLILTLINSLLNAFGALWFVIQIVRGAIIIGAVAWYVRSRV
jgi:ribose/xylose/arabinose/galactoside ABC-type transport system permease subunit